MLDNTIIGYSYFLLCFNVFSLIDNYNYFDKADLVISISNYSFNIISLNSLMVCSFLWFLFLKYCFLMIILISNLWVGQHHLHYIYFSRSVASLNSQLQLPPFPSNFYHYNCPSHILDISSVVVCFLQEL